MDDLPPSSEAPLPPTPRASSHGHGDHAHDDHGHEHHELGFIRTYIFSTDHKTIGIQYMFGGLVFLFFGFCLMLLMRWQLAFPGQALPGPTPAPISATRSHEILYHLGIGSHAAAMPDAVPAGPESSACFCS